tara:strand:- start:941 stop:1126 length:186 start_codon:yes stop_codon:yes gene_type:complete
MKDKLFYFVLFDKSTQRSKTLEIQAKTFGEATPAAFVYRASLNRRYSKSNWDVVSVNSMIT